MIFHFSSFALKFKNCDHRYVLICSLVPDTCKCVFLNVFEIKHPEATHGDKGAYLGESVTDVVSPSPGEHGLARSATARIARASRVLARARPPFATARYHLAGGEPPPRHGEVPSRWRLAGTPVRMRQPCFSHVRAPHLSTAPCLVFAGFTRDNWTLLCVSVRARCVARWNSSSVENFSFEPKAIPV